MGKLNTGFNGASAYYNRRTAHAAEETSRGVGKLVDSDRQRYLRERGLITHQATPRQIAKVETRLAAQDRARRALEGDGPVRQPYVEVVAAAVVLPILVASVAVGAGIDRGIPALLAIAALAVVLAVHLPLVRRRERHRTEMLARAAWGKGGKCRWCGAHRSDPDAHLVDGEQEHPRVAHAEAVEQAIGR